MKKKFLEAGKIVNTHGIRGEIKIQPWCDSAAFLASFRILYIDGVPVKMLSARAQKDSVIASLEGIDTIEDAIRMKNKIVSIDRDDVQLEEGKFFVHDIIGLTAIDNDTGNEKGRITDVLEIPSGNIYVIKPETGSEILVPAVDEFIIETNIEDGYVKIHFIEGM